VPNLTRPQWIEHLRRLAADGGAGGAAPGELPGAGLLAEPLRRSLGRSPGAGTAPDPPPAGEIGLWWAVCDPAVDVGRLLRSPTAGSLLPRDRFRAVEVWTEADLCGLHALGRLARARGRDDWATRALAVAAWHVEHTQPDNATNRPWAVSVFLSLATPEGRSYAETLVHNCLAMSGRPDPLSAWILADAARELELGGEG
jgi:hypothetical protein